MAVLVVGCGIIGLRTAVELLKRSIRVVLRAPEPTSTSNGAGGLWMPFHCEDERVNQWSQMTLNNVDTYENHTEWLDCVYLQRDKGEEIPEWSSNPSLKFQGIEVEKLNQQTDINIPFLDTFQSAGYHHVWRFRAPVMNTEPILRDLLSQVENHPLADVNVHTNHWYSSIEEMKHPDCDIVVNTTGTGIADPQVLRARGILLHFKRQDEDKTVIMTEQAPWGSETKPCYLIPRGDRLIVGGSYLEGDEHPGIRPEERDELREKARHFGITREPIGEWTGFRPVRSTGCRVEREGDVVHAYGFGGSGWTVHVGVAKQVVDLVLSK